MAWLYIAGYREGGPVFIGRADHLSRTLAQLQSKAPARIRYLHTYKCPPGYSAAIILKYFKVEIASHYEDGCYSISAGPAQAALNRAVAQYLEARPSIESERTEQKRQRIQRWDKAVRDHKKLLD